jgi:hypothetical protein
LVQRSSLLPYPSIERHWLILDDNANVRASSAVHRRIPGTVAMPFFLNVRRTSFPKRKKIAGPDPAKRLVNVRSTMPPVTSIPAAGSVSRL